MINLSDERKIKLELLKRQSRRKNLIKEINFMNLTKEPYLDIEDNDLFCKNVFSLLNTVIEHIIPDTCLHINPGGNLK
ncbi:YxiF family protein [Metabacillus malikii]|uniref:YxiF family protein n=1 Tax=Metabacillus malikii TaxID=1504265 RepID=UPI003F9E6228